MRTPEEVAFTLGITPQVAEARKAAIGLDQADRQLLHSAQAAGVAAREAILGGLFRRMLDHPETRALFLDRPQIERVQEQQRRYLKELFEADLDWFYILRRLWTGVVHHRIHLSPQWFLMCYSHYICGHLQHLYQQAPEPALAQAQVIALIKSCLFDASLALDAYGHLDIRTH